MKIIVCGSHLDSKPGFIWQWLDKLHKVKPITLLIHGGAKHVDTWAGKWAYTRGVKVSVHHANWRKYGLAAGPIRNAEMLKEKPDAVIAFPGGRGTANMCNQAKEAGVPVTKISYPRHAE